MNRNEKGLKLLALGLAALTYAGAVVYGDIMFLQVVNKAFPQSGLLQALAYAGAVVTAISALTLPISLHWWFSPGLQFIWGVVFWFVDIAALALNSILAYQTAIGNIDSALVIWQQLAPATPMLAVIGWGVAFLLDPSHQARHARAEMEADQIDIYARHMKEAAKSDEVFDVLKQAALDNANEFARSIGARRTKTRTEPAETERPDPSRQNGHRQRSSLMTTRTNPQKPRHRAHARFRHRECGGERDGG